MAPTSPGSQSIGGSEDACAFAQAVRERLGEIIKSHRIRHTRLFFYGPFALSVFLGQQLTSVGEVQLFEYQDPGYVRAAHFEHSFGASWREYSGLDVERFFQLSAHHPSKR